MKLEELIPNKTPFEHAAIAVIVQIIITLISLNPLAGCMAGCFAFIGREVTQAEYRWISLLGKGKRENMPTTGGFDLRVWTKPDAWYDWIIPCVSCAIVYYGFRVLFGIYDLKPIF